MPEIGEVARCVHYLRKHLVGRTITQVLTQEDDIVYGKVGCSASAFEKAMTGKKIISVGQQGKYFYLVSSSPPHPVLHLGMTGWIKFSTEDSAYYRAKKDDGNPWPPRFWKWIFKTSSSPDSPAEPSSEVAFVDARRLARIRLVDCPADQIRLTSPLKENGPDPVVDRDRLTVPWLAAKLQSKRVPVKALLLDQANISGVGNWVADEVLYQAAIHPEQYSNTLTETQVQALHDKLIYVCTTACDLLADSESFPADWLMKHRWDKGKKGDANVLPNGERITHLTVGGRTSAVVLSRQKKTGPVPEAAVKAEQEAVDAGGDTLSDANTASRAESKGSKGRKRKVKAAADDAPSVPSSKPKRSKKTAAAATATKDDEQADSGAELSTTKTSKRKTQPKVDGAGGRRRSARLSQ